MSELNEINEGMKNIERGVEIIDEDGMRGAAIGQTLTNEEEYESYVKRVSAMRKRVKSAWVLNAVLVGVLIVIVAVRLFVR